MSQLAGYKIWTLVDPEFAPSSHFANPEGLNYKTGLHIRLQKKALIVSGQLMKMEYFCHYDRETREFSDKVLEVNFEWMRNATTKVLEGRRGEIKWVLSETDAEGNLQFGDHIKQTEKPYDARTAALADGRRRRNIIDEALALIDFMASNLNPQLLGYVQTMLRTLDDEVNTYINTNDRKLVEKIGSYSGSWLDMDVYPVLAAIGKQDIFEGITLRQALMGTLSYQD